MVDSNKSSYKSTIKIIDCVTMYDLLIRPDIKGLKYFCLRFRCSTDVKYLILRKDFASGKLS